MILKFMNPEPLDNGVLDSMILLATLPKDKNNLKDEELRVYSKLDLIKHENDKIVMDGYKHYHFKMTRYEQDGTLNFHPLSQAWSDSEFGVKIPFSTPQKIGKIIVTLATIIVDGVSIGFQIPLMYLILG